jgi:hypothetical protein
LETRGLDALAREKAIDRRPMDTEDAADADGVEPAVVDQAANSLRMDAQLISDVTDADQTPGFFAYRRHNSDEASQVQRSRSWADRTNRPGGRTY